jgi:Chlorophyll A-B binding protein
MKLQLLPFHTTSSTTALHYLLYFLVVSFLTATTTTTAAFNLSPVRLSEELGCSPTLAILFQTTNDEGVFFDPLGLATDENFSRYREAELKHGRVAMLSVIATLASWDDRTQMLFPMLRRSDADNGNNIINNNNPWPPVLELLQHYKPAEWGTFVLVCGILETLILVQVHPHDMPGDYGLGYWGVRDKGRHERSLQSELENGRLAMLVMFIYFLQDVTIHWESYLQLVQPTGTT